MCCHKDARLHHEQFYRRHQLTICLSDVDSFEAWAFGQLALLYVYAEHFTTELDHAGLRFELHLPGTVV